MPAVSFFLSYTFSTVLSLSISNYFEWDWMNSQLCKYVYVYLVKLCFRQPLNATQSK